MGQSKVDTQADFSALLHKMKIIPDESKAFGIEHSYTKTDTEISLLNDKMLKIEQKMSEIDNKKSLIKYQISENNADIYDSNSEINAERKSLLIKANDASEAELIELEKTKKQLGLEKKDLEEYKKILNNRALQTPDAITKNPLGKEIDKLVELQKKTNNTTEISKQAAVIQESQKNAPLQSIANEINKLTPEKLEPNESKAYVITKKIINGESLNKTEAKRLVNYLMDPKVKTTTKNFIWDLLNNYHPSLRVEISDQVGMESYVRDLLMTDKEFETRVATIKDEMGNNTKDDEFVLKLAQPKHPDSHRSFNRIAKYLINYKSPEEIQKLLEKTKNEYPEPGDALNEALKAQLRQRLGYENANIHQNNNPALNKTVALLKLEKELFGITQKALNEKEPKDYFKKEIQRLEESEHYKTLKTHGSTFGKVVSKVGIENRDSIKAFDKLVKDTEKKLDEKIKQKEEIGPTQPRME